MKPKPSENEAAWRLRIEKLTLAPGDTLVAQFDERTTLAAAQTLRDYLETCTPVGVAVMLIGPNVRLSVLAKNAEAA